MTNFHDSHPQPTGARLVLQDLDPVLKTTGQLPPRIEKTSHDFFQEQPIKAARAYYFHRVVCITHPARVLEEAPSTNQPVDNFIQFHDWSDEKCREILLALRPAMVPGYSKVLLQESVLPSQGATWLNTVADLAMMCGLAGRERTEHGFSDLFESVGMKISAIYTRAPGEESIIEAIIPE